MKLDLPVGESVDDIHDHRTLQSCMVGSGKWK
jgi:hypothetical protein